MQRTCRGGKETEITERDALQLHAPKPLTTGKGRKIDRLSLMRFDFQIIQALGAETAEGILIRLEYFKIRFDQPGAIIERREIGNRAARIQKCFDIRIPKGVQVFRLYII